MLEVEVKIKVELDKVKNRLEGLGFIKGTSVYEKDVYYNSEFKNLKSEDKALRIREYKDLDNGTSRFVLNFKGPKIDKTTMSRQETEFEIPSFEDGDSILNGLGFFKAGNVEKTRTYYNKEKTECCLDSVKNLGEFLEIEIMAEEKDYNEAINTIEHLLTELSLSMKDSIRTSYLSMLQNV